jgi:hypothetical protein
MWGDLLLFVGASLVLWDTYNLLHHRHSRWTFHAMLAAQAYEWAFFQRQCDA